MLNVKVQFLLDEEIALGPGKVALIEAIAETGSISAAARAMDMSYRRAWLLVDTLNRCFTAPVVETRAGQGARVTPLGHDLADAYGRLIASLQPCADNPDRKIIEDALCSAPLSRSGAADGRPVVE